jgi:hypothetical protein
MPESRSERDKKIIKKKEKEYKRMRDKYGVPDCPRGKIVREGYVKLLDDEEVEVPPTCVKDTGRKGKGEKIPVVLEESVLADLGYSGIKKLSAAERRKALKKAIWQGENALSLFRRLVYIATLNKNKDPELFKRLRSDALWIKKELGFEDKSKSKGKRKAKSKSKGKRKTKSKSKGKRKSKSKRKKTKSKSKRKYKSKSKGKRKSKSKGKRKSKSKKASIQTRLFLFLA